jgi:cation diffusion facilitator CzcD-associated flavoprotein CzcO
VLVVGGGNSGFQIASELATTRAVDLAIGTRNATVPQRPLGRDIFWWQTITGLITAPATSRRGHWMRRGEGTVIGLSTRDLRRAGTTLRPRLISTHDNHAVFSDGTVVWATGFHRDHSWINIPEALDGNEHLRHVRGITPGHRAVRTRPTLATHRRVRTTRVRERRRRLPRRAHRRSLGVARTAENALRPPPTARVCSALLLDTMTRK